MMARSYLEAMSIFIKLIYIIINERTPRKKKPLFVVRKDEFKVW